MIRFRRQPREKGLARVCQGTRGFELWDGNKRVGVVAVSCGFGGNRYADSPWYWYCGGANTSDTPVPTAEEAKKQCMEHYKKSRPGIVAGAGEK